MEGWSHFLSTLSSRVPTIELGLRFLWVQVTNIKLTFITGTDSPVNMDSSTMTGPLSRSKSHGTSLSSTDLPKIDRNWWSSITWKQYHQSCKDNFVYGTITNHHGLNGRVGYINIKENVRKIDICRIWPRVIRQQVNFNSTKHFISLPIETRSPGRSSVLSTGLHFLFLYVCKTISAIQKTSKGRNAKGFYCYQAINRKILVPFVTSSVRTSARLKQVDVFLSISLTTEFKNVWLQPVVSFVYISSFYAWPNTITLIIILYDYLQMCIKCRQICEQNLTYLNKIRFVSHFSYFGHVSQLLLDKRSLECNQHKKCENTVVPIFIQTPQSHTKHLEHKERRRSPFFEQFYEFGDIQFHAKILSTNWLKKV